MITTYPQAAPSRDARAIAEFERIDDSLAALAAEAGAVPVQYPALISRESLCTAEYPSAFPHLLLAAAPLREPEAGAARLLDAGNLDAPRWCLSPAVCYHVYAALAGQRVCTPTLITARGRCFRHEALFEPGRRQLEFEMREIVLIGSAQFVVDTGDTLKRRLEDRARAMELHGSWQVAEDPFFLPAASGKAMMQRLRETKLEYVSDGPRPLALASLNRHGDFFARRFDLRDAEGRFVHTACLAAGLDRWAAGAATDLKPEAL